MATVPRLGNPVQQAGLPNVRMRDASQGVDSFGGGQKVAEGFQASARVAQVGSELIQQEKKKADSIQLTQAYADAVKAKNDLMYNPKTGAVGRKGKEAFGAMDEYLPQFDQKMQEIEDGLGDDGQKAMFNEIKIKQKMDFDGDLQRHIFKESMEFEQETMTKGLEAAREDAIMNYQTPGKIAESIEVQKAFIISHAANNGRSPEWTEMALKTAESQTHKDVIERLLANGEDQTASLYYNKVRESIKGDDATDLEKSLEEGSLRGNSQRVSDELIVKYGSLSSAMKAVREIDDPKLRDSVQDRVRSEFAFREQENKRYLDTLEVNALNILDSTKGDLHAIPPQHWTKFDRPTRSGLEAYASNKKNGLATKTDIEKYYQLKELAGNPATRDKFLSQDFNLMKFAPYLSESDMKDFIDVQTKGRQGDTKELDGWRSDRDIIVGSFQAMNMKPDKDPEKFQMFAQKTDERVAQESQRLGRKLTNGEVQAIADDLRVEVTTNKAFFGMWNTKKKVYELDGTEKTLEIDIDDVPAREKKKIVESLRRNGKTVNNQNILQYYTKGLNRGS
jgi:hypothetical protein